MAHEAQVERDRQDFALKLALVSAAADPVKGVETFNLLAKQKTRKIAATTDSGISDAIEAEEAGSASTWELSGDITPEGFEAMLSEMSRVQVANLDDDTGWV